ncbi:siderophore-interacting protein [Dyella terrae]|uniref:siderophore-interacting protein n=1 Tax=Dyella terrae TaxID=522259 RepID=UPI001EFCBB00|nr:siderophore-interacting protein [Dyella terrae]ULU25793.1 siderophore-interacting protein [Dyella terrae]
MSPVSPEIRRVRHPLKMRELIVKRLAHVSPRLLCVTLTGDLADFVSASFDDHVKLFLPAEGESRPSLPTVTEQGIEFDPSRPRPASRDYTPRRYDRAANELDIEFVLHGEGPAASWARNARVGDLLGVGGPRGSSILPDGLDWNLLLGDETALPAIARRLEEATPGECIIAIIEVEDGEAVLDIPTAAQASVTWLRRDADKGGLPGAVSDLILPEGHGFAWAAGEYASIRQVRQRLIEVHGLDRQRIKASSYWKQGEVASHETLSD